MYWDVDLGCLNKYSKSSNVVSNYSNMKLIKIGSAGTEKEKISFGSS